MRCLSPVTIENPQYKYHIGLQRYIEVPCGRCQACRKNYSLEWSIRLFEESKDWRFWSFLTLTYKPDYLSEKDLFIGDVVNYKNVDIELFSLSKVDVKSYLKSLRKRVPPRSFAYFLCGEYGSHTARPHVHLILFFNNVDVLYEARKLWSDTRGLVHITANNKTHLLYNERSNAVQYATSYAAKYACKQSDMPFFYNDDGSWKDSFDKPFRLMSKGLGSGYFFTDKFERLWKLCHDPFSTITDNDFCYTLPNGTNVGLPRFYRNKLIKKQLPDELRKEIEVTPFGDKIETPKRVSFTSSTYRKYVAHKRSLDKAQLHQIDANLGYREAMALELRATQFDEQAREDKCRIDRDRDYAKSKF